MSRGLPTSAINTPPEAAGPGWLTPRRCRLIFILLLIGGMIAQWQYLTRACNVDLSGDEAQYWDWSRNPDWSYYSKGPAIAYIIRFGCWLMGEQTMPAVRLPAILLAGGTAVCLWNLVLRLFGSHRLALSTVLLAGTVPIAVAGTVAITIDSPLIFCWSLATWLAAIALDLGPKGRTASRPRDESAGPAGPVWPWVLIGLVAGAGFLAKYAMLLWYAGLLLFLLIDRHRSRPGIWRNILIALGITAAMTYPVFHWNAQHGWVSAFHVRKQTGTGFKLTNPLEFMAIQVFVVVGLGYTFVLIGAIAHAIRSHRAVTDATRPCADVRTREMLLLLCLGGSFFVINAIWSLFTKIQPNWPVPGYVTLLVLGAYFMSRRLVHGAPHRRFWLANLIITATLGVAVLPFVYDASILVPGISWANRAFAPKRPIRDPLYKLRGWRILGPVVASHLAESRPGAFVLADDYQMTAQLAFYVTGQPKTYCAGPYYQEYPTRLSQYDMWADRALDRGRSTLIGRDAIFIGKEDNPRPELFTVFQSSTELAPVTVTVRGESVRTFRIWRLEGFKGFPQRQTSTRF